MVDHCCATHMLVVHFFVFRKVACSNQKLILFHTPVEVPKVPLGTLVNHVEVPAAPGEF